MSDKKDTAASPESEETTANTEDEIIEAAGDAEPEFHIYVRHIGRDNVSRASRRARAGHRRQGALLDNGVRIRKKGRKRLTKISAKEFVNNHERLFYYIDNGIIEAVEPASMHIIPRDDLLGILAGLTDKINVADEIVPMAYITGKHLGQVKEEKKVEQVPVVEEPVMEEPEMTEEPSEPELVEADLKKMSREELDKMAQDNDIDPSGYGTKNKLIAALLGE